MHDSTPSDSFEDYRFAAYLSGAMSPDERVAFEAWIAATPDGAHRLDAARTAWNAGVRPAVPVDTNAAWVRVRASMALLDGSDVASVTSKAMRNTPPLRESPRTMWPRTLRQTGVPAWRYALGGVTAFLVLTAAWFWSGGLSRGAHVAGNRYATGIGQRRAITLSDGTRIRLAPQTVVQVAPGFGVGTRTVSVQGEAYFDVAHASGTPFLVQTRHTTTRVLGTAFDVRDYAEDSAVSVTVVTGKVAVARLHNDHPAVMLTSGMSALVPDSSNVRVAISDASHDALWVDGQLVFHETPVPAVLATITRWYGYQFRVTDSTLVALRLTMGLSTESSQAALETLRHVLDVDLRFDHGVVVISPRRNVRAPERKQNQLTPHETEVGR